MTQPVLSVAALLLLTGCAELLNLDSFKDAEGGASTGTETTSTGAQGGTGGSGGASNGGAGGTGGSGGSGGSIPTAQCSTTPSITEIYSSPVEMRVRDFTLVSRPGQNKPIVYGVVSREDGALNVREFIAFSLTEQQTPITVTFASSSGGLEVSHVDFAPSSNELIAYVRNGQQVGEVRWRTDLNGLVNSVAPTFTPYTAATCPVDTFVTDLKMQLPNAPMSPRLAYVCRPNVGTNYALKLGSPASISTVATGPSLSAGYFGKAGTYDILFTNDDSATGVRVGKQIADLATVHPLSLETDPMRTTVLFSAHAKGPMETKFFLATLKTSGFIPGRIFQRDINENTASELTQSPQPGFTQLVELNTIENLVRWFPLVANPSYLAGAGVSFDQKSAKFTLLNKAGDVLVLNHDAYSASGTDEVRHVGVAEPDGAQFRVVFIEKAGGDFKLRARVVSCVGGV